ncbi:hypothetical protein [Streptomyces dysideae]|uniref:Uncharacterized protein n=1 Tax=Streptomyces dysideae TaxID=909626 RepID=A0A101V5U9_9ACTN|nr:hypothetical protein [Streptomyces dysideae]KUO23048.1 hypothetical protein AQJ91_00260 [Streptomyces dysideae]
MPKSSSAHRDAPDVLLTFDLVILDVTLPGLEELKQNRRLLAPDRPAVLLLLAGAAQADAVPSERSVTRAR